MEELIQIFNNNNIRYLVFGGQAVRLHGMPRFSMDWDIFIPGENAGNMQRINELLEEELDMPLVPIGPKGENLIQTYQTRWGIIQFHLAVAGIRSFDEAEARSVERVNEAGVKVRTFCLDDLILSKETVNRPQDVADADFLKLKRSSM